jgi:AcrR family transcriptional regulator
VSASKRPAGRAARVYAAVLDATSEMLTEVDYDLLSTDEVASRAGVHKTTVYRRWQTKPELIAAAVAAHAEQNMTIADTGTIAGDLHALARTVVANVGPAGGAHRSRFIVAAGALAGPTQDATATSRRSGCDRCAVRRCESWPLSSRLFSAGGRRR